MVTWEPLTTGETDLGDEREAQRREVRRQIHGRSAPPDLGPVRASLAENRTVMDEALGTLKSYDIVYREFHFGGLTVGTYVINGFFQGLMNLETLKAFERLADEKNRRGWTPPAGDPVEAVRSLLELRLTYSQVTTEDDLTRLVFEVTSGPMVILVDGARRALVVDTRFYPDRSPSEPDTERVIRGPHDGFVENIIVNTALIRRRIRDPRLRTEIMQIGVRSETDVVLMYMEGLTSPELVAAVHDRLERIEIDALPMGERTVAEYLVGQPWNPFPRVRFTERPDVAAHHLMEGHVLVVVDTTPQVIIAPATLWHHLEHPEDYHVNASAATYMRWTQFVGVFFASILPPLWLALAIDPRLRHALPWLAFVGPRQPSAFPLGLQLVGAEVALDLLRRAILNTPGSLSQTMGILGAIVLGDLAAKAGIFSPEAIVYLVLAAVAQFAISGIELGMALRLVRFTLVVAVWAWKLPGLLIGAFFWLLVVLQSRSFGVPYTWPLIPFDWPALRAVLERQPVPLRGPRPRVLHPQDRTRS